jgi:hypothetical protein
MIFKFIILYWKNSHKNYEQYIYIFMLFIYYFYFLTFKILCIMRDRARKNKQINFKKTKKVLQTMVYCANKKQQMPSTNAFQFILIPPSSLLNKRHYLSSCILLTFMSSHNDDIKLAQKISKNLFNGSK